MKENGCAVIIITHKLNEVKEISDRVTILRKGKSVGTILTKSTDEAKLAEAMVGRPVNLSIERPLPRGNREIMQVKNLTVVEPDEHKSITDLSFALFTGEILGVAGIAGSGQKALCESLTGLQRAHSGEIVYEGQNVFGKSASEIMKLGVRLAFVPEDRLGMGLVGSMGIADNMLLKTYSSGKGVFVNRRPALRQAERLIKRLDIQTPGVDTPIRRLSGGNIQKVLLGREIESRPKVLIVAYPVRGLDINTSYAIYDLLNEQKRNGAAIIFCGEDIDVLLEISDRILVLSDGKATGVVDAATATKEEVGLMMAGVAVADALA
jgi:simple sugar transport system ATP-binding protein